MFRNYTYN